MFRSTKGTLSAIDETLCLQIIVIMERAVENSMQIYQHRCRRRRWYSSLSCCPASLTLVESRNIARVIAAVRHFMRNWQTINTNEWWWLARERSWLTLCHTAATTTDRDKHYRTTRSAAIRCQQNGHTGRECSTTRRRDKSIRGGGVGKLEWLNGFKLWT